MSSTDDARFRALTEASSDVLYRMDASWTEMRQLGGGGFIVDTDAPSRAWIDEYIPEDERPRVRAAIDAAIRTKSIFDLEHRVWRADVSLEEENRRLRRENAALREDREILKKASMSFAKELW